MFRIPCEEKWKKRRNNKQANLSCIIRYVCELLLIYQHVLELLGQPKPDNIYVGGSIFFKNLLFISRNTRKLADFLFFTLQIINTFLRNSIDDNLNA